MRNAGKLQTGDDPSSEDYAMYMPVLNDIFNFFQTSGIKLWLNYDLSITLVAGQALYTLGPTGNVIMTKPLRVMQGYFLDQYGDQQPLIPMSWDEYKRLSNVTQQGSLNSYFVDKQQLTLNVYFWLTPDVTAALGTGHIIIQQQVTNIISLTDSMNFPQEWFIALHWALCDEIATGQPEAITARAATKAKIYKEALEDWDVEDASTSFAPDQRGTYYGRNFR
jgi:hypothetical protein